MQKRLLFFPYLVEFFLSLDHKEFEREVRRTFKHHFEFREEVLIIPEEGIVLLEKVLEELKGLWLKDLPLPLPVSLVPMTKGPYRPGRVYLLEKEAKALSPRLSSLPFLAKIRPWRGLLELVLPATEVAEGLLFRYRDLLLIGSHPPCPFCGLKWHEAKRCPSLAEKDPFEVIQEFLRYRPQHLAERLNEALEKGKGQRLFSGRYPYFQLSFLRRLFNTNAASWDGFSLRGGLEKGGQLFLALEALVSGDLVQARKRFSSVEGGKDPRPHLGLAMVSLLEGNLSETFYELESARSRAETPLYQAYLLLLKGWLLEREKKYFEAEEQYKEALKRDRSFWPARFHLATMEIKFARERVLSKLKQLVYEPLCLPVLFLEGRFLPLAEEAEKLVLETFEEKQAQALNRLARAEDTLRPLLKALPEEEVKHFEEALAEIRDKVYQGGFVDLLLAEKRAFDLSLELQGYLFRQTKKVREKLKEISSKITKLEEFWRFFPYRKDDHPFQLSLKEIRDEIESLQQLLKSDPSRHLKKIHSRIKVLEEKMVELQEQEKELRREWQFRKQLAVFVKTFLVLELILFGLFLVLPLALKAVRLPSYQIGDLSTFLFLSLLFLGLSLWRALLQKT